MGDFFYGVKSVVNRKTAFLELEVNERLNIAALHLDDDVDDCHDEQGAHEDVGTLNPTNDTLMP